MKLTLKPTVAAVNAAGAGAGAKTLAGAGFTPEVVAELRDEYEKRRKDPGFRDLVTGGIDAGAAVRELTAASAAFQQVSPHVEVAPMMRQVACLPLGVSGSPQETLATLTVILRTKDFRIA